MTATVDEGTALKFAVTDVAAVMVIAQALVPLHAPPLQPVNAYPLLALAVRVTWVLFAKFVLLHVVGQLIPAGVLVTVPPPVGEIMTCSVGFAVKVAVTEVAAETVTLQAALPLQAPPQPVNVNPVPAVAVNVTWVPLVKVAVQVGPQLIPDGLLATVPVPVTATVRADVCGAVEPDAAVPPPHPARKMIETASTRIKQSIKCDGRPEFIRKALLLWKP